MESFRQRFEIIYNKYSEGLTGTGARPNASAFARFLELPVSTVRSWEKRDVLPAAKDLKLIHDKMGFAYDWLIAGEGEIYDTKEEKIARLEKENEKLRALVGVQPHSCDEDTSIAEAVGQG